MSVAFGLLTLLLVVPCAAEWSSGYLRTVEGRADLLGGGSLPAIEAAANYPIQVGDQLRVSQDGLLEAALPDGSLLRFAGNTELRFTRIALSVETRDNQTVTELLQGEIQVAIVTEPAEHREFQVDTANASVFLLARGSYRIFTDGKSWTQVVVRSGYVEVVTEQERHHVNAGQQALIDGQRSPQVSIQAAPATDNLEQWAQFLEIKASNLEAKASYPRETVSSSLRYAAAPLHRHGRWMTYRGAQVWRPHVEIGWRPYHSGWWVYTGSGLTWVSTEPWGWVAYHYGNWGYANGIGWVWSPGSRYTPGSVYWYWGPTHVGWIPAGYFASSDTPYYNAMPPHGHYGGLQGVPRHPYRGPVSAGDLATWRNWTFSSYEDFGYRDSHRSLITGADLEKRGVFRTGLPDGVVTTDTRGLSPNLWDNPNRAMRVLEMSPRLRSLAVELSPLGTAAISGSPINPARSQYRTDSLAIRPDRASRQWDSKLWRREHSTRLKRSTSGSIRRDGPSLAPGLRGHSTSTRPLQTRPQPQRLSRPSPGISSRSGSVSRSRTPSSTSSSGTQMNRAPTRNRGGSSSAGRVSGSRPSGGKPSGDGGSG